MLKVCEWCRSEWNAKRSIKRFCSNACRAKANGATRRGPMNHNYKGANKLTACLHCGKEFRSYAHKYCSKACSHPRAVRKPCPICGKRAYRPDRTFCSRACYLSSDDFVADTVKIFKKRKDANHHPIVDALNKMGAFVIDMSSLGRGVPDIIFWCGFEWHVAEIKNPDTRYGRSGLNKNQQEWARQWGAPVHIIRTVEDAAAIVNGSRLKMVGPPGPPAVTSVSGPEEALQAVGL